MKKTYILENLGCAHCAAKMEEGIQKIEGVEEATISFMTRKLVIVGPDEIFEDILPKLEKIVKKVEPDVEVKCR